MTEHTPGPWTWQWAETQDGNADGRVYSDWRDTINLPICIAVSPRYRKRDRWEADASLIAAAPELLEVLKAYVAWEVEYMTINNLGDPEKQHNVKWARSVIAKATTPALPSTK